VLTLFWFLVALGVLVTFHEFGHYYVARLAGVKVLRFSVGFGKPLYSWKRNCSNYEEKNQEQKQKNRQKKQNKDRKKNNRKDKKR